jgi:hypothetical protein
LIFVECTFVSSGSKLERQFTAIDDFNKWYNITKTDTNCIINIMKYDPTNNPGLKLTNDISLLKAPRGREI